MDYNKIQTFVLVAELGSVTEAARRLHRSQSAISQQIQALEVELDLRLLERKAGKILLSADGERLYQIAKDRLSQIGDEVQLMKKASNSVEGHLRLGILEDFANEFDAGASLARLCIHHPKISVSVSYGTSESLEKDLIENRVDLACFVFFTKPELFIRTSVSSTKHNLYTSNAYLKRCGHIRSYSNVLDCDLLDLHRDFTTLTPWFRKNASHLVPTLRHRKPNMTAPNHNTLRQILHAGFGIAIMPDYLMVNSVADGICAQVLSSAKSITSGLDLAYRTNKTLRLCEKLLIEELINSAQ